MMVTPMMMIIIAPLPVTLYGLSTWRVPSFRSTTQGIHGTRRAFTRLSRSYEPGEDDKWRPLQRRNELGP